MAADPGAVGKSADDRLRAENMAAKVQAQEKAKARKEKMLAMEATRKAKLPKTDLEQEDENAMSQLLGSAQQAKDESLDMVKSMNRQVQYAKCATIRDAQLIEKQMLLKQQQEEEAESFRRMEEERIKALQLMEEREEQKRQERMRGAQIIQMQIRQREEEKLREAGLLDQERQAMLKKAEELNALTLQRKEEARLAGQRMLQEAAETNAAAIEMKKRQKLEMEEENLRIALYIAERDRKEQERLDALEADAKHQAEETARMRAQQEKFADSAAERDAIRAKRAAEDYERAWRAKEKAETDRKAAMLSDILHSRKEMAAKKEQVLSQAAQMEKEQFQRILQVQREQELAEIDKERARAEENLRHNSGLRQQIAAKEEQRQRARQQFLEEGAQARHDVSQEHKRLEQIKTAKIVQLRKAGVPSKYLAELETFSVSH